MAAPAEPARPVLSARKLSVQLPGTSGLLQIVDDISFDVQKGRTLAIVGESGSGKTTTALAVLGLLPAGSRITGSVDFNGRDLITLRGREINSLRGDRIGYVPQNPTGSLNPVLTVGRQIGETIRSHRDMSAAGARQRAQELLEIVGVDSPARRLDSYPHELSGGIRQRVVIAAAIANDPDLIVADEPTSALDATTKAQVLETLRSAQEVTGAALLLISHDLGVVAQHADSVVVMYQGRVAETGAIDDIFYRPAMPYTLGLLASLPRIDGPHAGGLQPGSGLETGPVDAGQSCAFAPRCPVRIDQCTAKRPALRSVSPADHRVACIRSAEISTGELTPYAAADGVLPAVPAGAAAASGRPPLLAVSNLTKHFERKHPGFPRGRLTTVHAVCDMSFTVGTGETLAVVGESGSGKTTLSRILVRLTEPTSGDIALDGASLLSLPARDMQRRRRDLQMVLQDSSSSLNPRMSVGDLIAEPLRIHGGYSGERVRELLIMVGLRAEHAGRFPRQFSGGQRQRIAIARALAVRPKLLILDEPTSALDVSVQAGILVLLRQLQDQLGLSYVLVTHDLDVARYMAHQALVVNLGRIVERGDVTTVLDNPLHPYTRALLSASPVPDPRRERMRQRIVLAGEPPSASDLPSGCRFRTRCPLFAQSLTPDQQSECTEKSPELRLLAGRALACHHVTPEPQPAAAPQARQLA